MLTTSPDPPIGQKVVDLVIYFNFKPEEFHVRLFQKLGRVSRIEDKSSTLCSVKSEDVGRIASTSSYLKFCCLCSHMIYAQLYERMGITILNS